MNKKECEKFFHKVIKDLGHHGWKLEWYKDDSSEGYCWLNRKVINVGPSNSNVNRLILHEIAHIDTCLEDNCKHRIEFWNRYEKLLEEYMPGTPISEYDKIVKDMYARC